VTYQQMIDAAFAPAVASDAEAQFSRIWGQAIHAYEATLIPDETPFDRYLAGETSAMTATQIEGWKAFKDPNRADCFGCHAGSELSDATVAFAQLGGLIDADGGDQGFHNIGASPTSDDLGRGAAGPNGVKWSVSGSTFDNGAFKTPALRNVKLTAPYMHNGVLGDLDSVMGFYVNNLFNNPEESGQLRDIRLRGADRAAIVDFLMNGLTDCRVEKEGAPFDHPSLPLPNGTALPAVGAAGTGACQ
jgi:cytochrome c peroxidase